MHALVENETFVVDRQDDSAVTLHVPRKKTYILDYLIKSR